MFQNNIDKCVVRECHYRVNTFDMLHVGVMVSQRHQLFAHIVLRLHLKGDLQSFQVSALCYLHETVFSE